MSTELTNLVKQAGDLAELLTSKHAQWHKSCALKYSGLKFKRAQKRSKENLEEASTIAKMFRRSDSRESDPLANKKKFFFFFFGDEEATLKQKLPDVSTMDLVHRKIRDCALKL